MDHRMDRLERLFRAAVMHAPEERAPFIDAACADDPELRRELEDLLRADAEAASESYLEAGVSEWRSVLLGPPENAEPAGMVGRQVGPFNIVRLLGRGGMGEVYLAVRERPFKQYVALKIIRRGMDSPEVVKRFAAERQILAALDHPNIARLLDGGMTEEGLPFLAMEYVDGRPITEFCDEQRLTVRERLELFQTVCDAVHYAHQNLIIHRDLKPSNILVTRGSAVKLLDFGIAKLLNPHLSPVDLPATRTELRVMTPEYASPEQLRGDKLSTAADVYSLGVILYELLTGRRPHDAVGRSPHEFVSIVCSRDPQRPSSCVSRWATGREPEESPRDPPHMLAAARSTTPERLPRELRGDLDTIVLMALRKEPERRYRSAEQFAQDLDRHLSGLPVAARPSTAAYRLRKFTERHRRAVLAAVVVLLSLVSGLGAALWQAGEARTERARAEQALARSETVTTFLMELFQSTDPRETSGIDVTARELLARGVARADALEDRPELQAQLVDVIGRVYESLGQYERAETLLRRAVDLRRSAPGTQHLLVAESLTHLGSVLTHRGRYEEAEGVLQAALQIQTALGQEHHLGRAETYHNPGFLLPYVGRWEEAEAAYRKALELRAVVLGGDHPEVAATMGHLGAILRSRGRYTEAESLLRSALAVHERLQGGENLHVTHTLFQLAILLRQQGLYDEEEKHLRRAIALRTRLAGETDPAVSSYMFELGEVLHLTGRTREEEEMLRQALDLRTRVLGSHPSTSDGQIFLAIFLHDQGRLTEADTLFRQALSMRRELLGDEHQEVAVAMRYLARLQVDRRRYADADSLLTAAHAMHVRVNGPTHHHVAEALADLAQLRERMGEHEEAITRYTEALELLLRSYAEEDERVQKIRSRLAHLTDAT